MLNQRRARIQWLLAWFALNLVIFVAGYLNYRLQAKHRYLYRILGVSVRSARPSSFPLCRRPRLRPPSRLIVPPIESRARASERAPILSHVRLGVFLASQDRDYFELPSRPSKQDKRLAVQSWPSHLARLSGQSRTTLTKSVTGAGRRRRRRRRSASRVLALAALQLCAPATRPAPSALLDHSTDAIWWVALVDFEKWISHAVPAAIII